MRHTAFLLPVLCSLLLPTTIGCRQPTEESDKITIVLNWYPEAEHGGYYAALVHGYYEEAGLKVKIIPGGPGAPVIPKVDRGQATFGVENADKILQGRAQGADVIALMAPIQTSPRCILVHRKSGIRSLQELKNVTLAMNPGATWAKYLQKKLPLTNVKVVPSSGLALFLKNEDYAVQGYTFSEPLTAKENGADPVVLLVSDLGFNPYTSVLITQADTIKNRPELVRKLTAATIRGWKKYLEDPTKTNEYIHSLNKKMSPKSLKFGAEAMKPLCITKTVGEDNFGWMTAERWQTLAKQLEGIEALDAGKSNVDAAFTTEFLPASSK